MADKENDNLRIWNQVCDTKRADTKQVEYGKRKFTAIDAQKQIKRATELWGPIGGYWGIQDQNIVVVDGIVIYTAILFYHSKEVDADDVCTLPIASDHVFKPNEDSVKKVRTDALTKGLSWIGFNSDVFEGKFDDNKYTGKPPQGGPQQQERPRDRHPAKMTQADADAVTGVGYGVASPISLKMVGRMLAIARTGHYQLADLWKVVKLHIPDFHRVGNLKGEEFKEAIALQIEKAPYDKICTFLEAGRIAEDPAPPEQRAVHEPMTQEEADTRGFMGQDDIPF